MESLPQNTGQHEGLQTTPPPLLRQPSGLITETEEAQVGGCMSPAAPAERALGRRAMSDHRPGWPASSPDGFAAVLAEGLSLRGSTLLLPAATGGGSLACVSHPPQGALSCFAVPQGSTTAGCLPRAEPRGTPRLESRTQSGPFQKENPKGGVWSVALSGYACAQAARWPCYQAEGG